MPFYGVPWETLCMPVFEDPVIRHGAITNLDDEICVQGLCPGHQTGLAQLCLVRKIKERWLPDPPLAPPVLMC